jgi:hypothetical protein
MTMQSLRRAISARPRGSPQPKARMPPISLIKATRQLRGMGVRLRTALTRGINVIKLVVG